MEEQEPERKVPSRRLTLARSAGLGFALAGVIGIGWRQTHEPDPAPKFCTADGIIVPDSTHTYTRDPDRDCAWVDEDGNLLEFDADGRPIPG